MAKIIKLIHPKFGLCAQEIIRYSMKEYQIRKMWSKKYGQMYNQCSVEIFDDDPKIEEEFVIKNTRTGQIYENHKEASEETGLTITHINKILKRRMLLNSDYYLIYTHKEAI